MPFCVIVSRTLLQNEHETPDHMNLITFHEAMEHVCL